MTDSPRETTHSLVPPLDRCTADGPETAVPLRADWPEWLAWLPVPLLLAAIIAARAAGLSESYENDALRLVLSFAFYTLVSLGTLFLIGRSFLALGTPGLLLLECGVVLWSLAGTVGDAASHGDANINVTIFNIGILLAGLCHLAGAVLAMRPQQSLRAKPLWLGTGCALALGALGLVTWAARAGGLPVFFVPGQGGTPVRYWVLISAITMFVLSAGLLRAGQRAARSPFTVWYALALLLLAVGLFGVMIQLSLWSVVNWLGRTAQWLGGVYLLLAAIAALRESNLPLLPSDEKSRPAYYREAVAVAMVLAATAVRLAFLSAMGMRAPFVTFYPAVILAALYGGWRAGLLATVLSAIAADYFWMEPVRQLALGQQADCLSLVVFLLSGAMIAWISEALHRARADVFAAETQALLAAQREATAETLRESERRFKLSMEATSDGLWDWNAVTDEVYYSPSHYRILGYEPGGFPGTLQAWRERVHPEDLAYTLQANMDCLEGRCENFSVEYRMQSRTGDWRWIFARGKCITRDAQGRATRLIGTHVDITARKEAEEALRRSEARWNAAIESFAEGAIIATEDEQVIYWNPAARAMHGFTRPDEGIEPLEKTPVTFELWTPDRSHKLELDEWPMRRIKRGETVRNLELRIRRPDQGWEKVFSYSGAMVETASGERLIFLSVYDLTELRQAEAALRASLHEKEVLLKEVHHRVKNNMQVISSLVGLQHDRLQDTAMRSILQDVSHRVRSMALVHEKLYQSPDMARVDFAEYTRGLLNYLWRAHGTAASGVRLVTDLEPVPLSVNGAVPCGLILNELVSNALKHAFRGRDGGGEVAVSLRGGEEGRVCLRVRDNGVGLPPGLNWRQADSLGLRIVQILATQLHATVEVCNDGGTEFTITVEGFETP